MATFIDGRKAVAAAGTREALSATSVPIRSVTIQAAISGSIRSVFRLRGTKLSRMLRQLTMTFTIPAAPRVWPVQPLIELHGTAAPKIPDTALSSAASLALVATRRGIALAAGDRPITLTEADGLDDLRSVWVDAMVSGEAVTFVACQH